MFIKKKKKIHLVDFAVLVDYRLKIKKYQKVHGPYERTKKKTVEHEETMMVILFVVGAFGTVLKTGRTGNQKKNKDHPHHRTLKIC